MTGYWAAGAAGGGGRALFWRGGLRLLTPEVLEILQVVGHGQEDWGGGAAAALVMAKAVVNHC